MIHHYNRWALIILLLFTVPFYHFLFSRYLDLTECHFSSATLVPFPDSSDLYSRDPTSTSHILQKSSNFCCKINIFEKIKWFFASNITLVLRFMISNKFYYVQTGKVVNSKNGEEDDSTLRKISPIFQILIFLFLEYV